MTPKLTPDLQTASDGTFYWICVGPIDYETMLSESDCVLCTNLPGCVWGLEGAMLVPLWGWGRLLPASHWWALLSPNPFRWQPSPWATSTGQRKLPRVGLTPGTSSRVAAGLLREGRFRSSNVQNSGHVFTCGWGRSPRLYAYAPCCWDHLHICAHPRSCLVRTSAWLLSLVDLQ